MMLWPEKCAVFLVATDMNGLNTADQCQNLETRCQQILGVLFFQRKPQNTLITTINMYLIIQIRHNILIQCHGNYIEVEKKL